MPLKIKNCVSLICSIGKDTKNGGPTKKGKKLRQKSVVKPHFESPRASTHATTNEKKNETRRGRVGGETKIAREDKGSGGI